MNRARLAASTVALILLACGGSPTSPESGALPLRVVAGERGSGLKTPREEVVTTQARWNDLWNQIVSNRSPKPAVPAVDFTTDALIVVARGELGDSCRNIDIARVELRDGEYLVAVRDTRPPMSCVCPPVTVQPVYAVAVPRGGNSMRATYRSVTVGSPCS